MSLAATLASVAAIFVGHPVPVYCYHDWPSYDQAAALPPGTVWWAGVGGFYDWRTATIGLTRQTCLDIDHAAQGYTWQRGYAVWTLGHELGHASGIYDEDEADCFGARIAASLYTMLGHVSRPIYLSLRMDGMKLWGGGNLPIPVACFPS